MVHLAAVPLELGQLPSAEVDNMQVTVFPAEGHQRITLAEFAAAGQLCYSADEWALKVLELQINQAVVGNCIGLGIKCHPTC
jgi:hypothetical protein